MQTKSLKKANEDFTNTNNVNEIVANGETIAYLQNIGKNMLSDLKEFTNKNEQMLKGINDKFAVEFKSMLQFSSDYKSKIDGMTTDNNERLRKVDILKILREKLAECVPQLKNK